jgi:hypothetical protein
MKQLALLLVDVPHISPEKCPCILRILKHQQYFWLPKYPLGIFSCVIDAAKFKDWYTSLLLSAYSNCFKTCGVGENLSSRFS